MIWIRIGDLDHSDHDTSKGVIHGGGGAGGGGLWYGSRMEKEHHGSCIQKFVFPNHENMQVRALLFLITASVWSKIAKG